MSNVKYVVYTFSMYDHTGIKKYLEKMAGRGWMLEKTGPYFWKFRRIEPARLHFAVNYFPKASEYQPEPSEEQQTFFDYCEMAGWKLIATVAQMQIFCNEQEDPLPIETDARVQVTIISSAMKKSFLPAQFLLLFLGVVQGWLFLGRFFDHPISVLTDSTAQLSGICWAMVILLSSVELVNYFLWLRKAREAAERDGSFVATRSFPVLQKMVLLLITAWLLGILFMPDDYRQMLMAGYTICYVVILFGSVNGAKNYLKKRKLSAGKNLALTMVVAIIVSLTFTIGGTKMMLDIFHNTEASKGAVETYEYNGWTWEIYHDKLPLYLEDFTELSYDGYSCEWDVRESFLVAQYEAVQRPRMDDPGYPELTYTITKVKVPVFYELCFQELYELDVWKLAGGYIEEKYRDNYVRIDAEIWDADVAYREYTREEPGNHYLICWEDRILEIRLPEEPAEQQIAIIVEKLQNI